MRSTKTHHLVVVVGGGALRGAGLSNRWVWVHGRVSLRHKQHTSNHQSIKIPPTTSLLAHIAVTISLQFQRLAPKIAAAVEVSADNG
jgi:hypothetical protein